MPHMSADDRLKAIRETEGDTVKATLAPHFKVHHGSDGLDRFGPAPKQDRREYGGKQVFLAVFVLGLIGAGSVIYMAMEAFL